VIPRCAPKAFVFQVSNVHFLRLAEDMLGRHSTTSVSRPQFPWLAGALRRGTNENRGPDPAGNSALREEIAEKTWMDGIVYPDMKF